ncbi:MAG: hypothetical protein ACQERB_08915 [Promethearchaeati archaeon]
MKKTNKIFMVAFATFLILAWIGSPLIVAAQDPMTSRNYEIASGETYENGNITRIRVRNQLNQFNISGVIQWEGKIGEKDFIIEVTDTSGDMEMNMTCNEEQEELGLLMGNRYTIRNRNRYRYQEGFAVNLSCNCSEIQARLRIKATNQNRNGEWAFYNGDNEQWETVSTSNVDGYLTATTDHFSVWTILIPETNFTLWIILGGSVAAVAALGIVVYLYKRKR